MSFPLPLRIAQELPVRNSWEVIIKKLPIPLPILYYLELIREVLANTLYQEPRKAGFSKGGFCGIQCCPKEDKTKNQGCGHNSKHIWDSESHSAKITHIWQKQKKTFLKTRLLLASDQRRSFGGGISHGRPGGY